MSTRRLLAAVVVAALGCKGTATEHATPAGAVTEIDLGSGSGSGPAFQVFFVTGSPRDKKSYDLLPAEKPDKRRPVMCAHPGKDVVIDKWDTVAQTRCAIEDDASVALVVNGFDLRYDLGAALLPYSFERLPTGHLDYTAPDGRALMIAEPMTFAHAWVRALALGKARHAGFAPSGKRDFVLLVPTASEDRLVISDTARAIRELSLVGIAEDANQQAGDYCDFGGRKNAVKRVRFDAHVTVLDTATGQVFTKDFASANKCPTDPNTLNIGLIGGPGRTIDQVRADADWQAVQTWLASLR